MTPRAPRSSRASPDSDGLASSDSLVSFPAASGCLACLGWRGFPACLASSVSLASRTILSAAIAETPAMPNYLPKERRTMAARTIEVTELALRDGHQSLLATRMALEDMIGACADIDQAGFWSVECWGGATYDASIRFLNEDPWVRLRTFRQLMPNSRLQMLLRGQNLLGYRHYEDTVVDRFVDKAAENGMDVFRVFDALNDIRNLRRALQAVRRTGKHAQGTICYTVSPL